MIEVWKALQGKKSYVVSDEDLPTTWKYAKQHYKVANDKLWIGIGWIFNNELYLDNPHKKNAHKVQVVTVNKKVNT